VPQALLVVGGLLEGLEEVKGRRRHVRQQRRWAQGGAGWKGGGVGRPLVCVEIAELLVLHGLDWEGRKSVDEKKSGFFASFGIIDPGEPCAGYRRWLTGTKTARWPREKNHNDITASNLIRTLAVKCILCTMITKTISNHFHLLQYYITPSRNHSRTKRRP